MQKETVEKKIPVLVAAIICVFLFRTGFFAFLFLTPLAFVSYRYDYKAAWSTFFYVILGNLVVSLFFSASGAIRLQDSFLDILYFAGFASVFVWIVAPPPALPFKFSFAARFVCGSCLTALFLTILFNKVSSSEGFSSYLEYLHTALVAAGNSSGSLQSTLLTGIDAETILSLIKSIMVRGGSLVSCVFLIAVSHSIGSFFAGLSAGNAKNRSMGKVQETASANTGTAQTNLPRTGSLAIFHVAPAVIWVFSISLLLVVLARVTRLEAPEILLWNILILCIILYLAQGLGILQFFLTRFSMSTFARMLLVFLFFVFLFSPFLNTILMAGIFFLGIAENWAPFRVPKSNGPPSTPKAGDDGAPRV